MVFKFGKSIEIKLQHWKNALYETSVTFDKIAVLNLLQDEKDS